MRFRLYLLLIVGLCICMPAANSATLSYTGDLILDRTMGIPLCFQGLDNMDVPITGEPVLVTALDVYNINRLAPMTYAQPNGAYECLRANLRHGLYELQASGMGLMSDPVALTVVDTNRSFFAWSGALSVKERGQSQSRLATFGLYHELPDNGTYVDGTGDILFYWYFPDSPTEQFLLLDPDYPGGPVRIRMKGFRQAYQFLTWTAGMGMRFVGTCEFTMGNSAPVNRTCEIAYGDTFGLRVDVLDFARRNIYHIGGWPQNFNWYMYMH